MRTTHIRYLVTIGLMTSIATATSCRNISETKMDRGQLASAQEPDIGAEDEAGAQSDEVDVFALSAFATTMDDGEGTQLTEDTSDIDQFLTDALVLEESQSLELAKTLSVPERIAKLRAVIKASRVRIAAVRDAEKKLVQAKNAKQRFKIKALLNQRAAIVNSRVSTAHAIASIDRLRKIRAKILAIRARRNEAVTLEEKNSKKSTAELRKKISTNKGLIVSLRQELATKRALAKQKKVEMLTDLCSIVPVGIAPASVLLPAIARSCSNATVQAEIAKRRLAPPNYANENVPELIQKAEVAMSNLDSAVGTIVEMPEDKMLVEESTAPQAPDSETLEAPSSEDDEAEEGDTY